MKGFGLYNLVGRNLPLALLVGKVEMKLRSIKREGRRRGEIPSVMEVALLHNEIK